MYFEKSQNKQPSKQQNELHTLIYVTRKYFLIFYKKALHMIVTNLSFSGRIFGFVIQHVMKAIIGLY